MSTWISVKDKLPEIKGRFLILVDFINPCISNDEIVREKVAFVSNFIPEKGWMSKCDFHEITHWREIPDIGDNL
jgi:hypothetical protein